MPLVKKVFWSEEETKCLVAIWGSPEFQEKMENSTRKNGLYVELTEELAKAGFHRTPEQVINKLKKIKKEYRDHKGGFNKPQGRPLYKTAYFGLLDSVMSHRRENQIAGELDSDEVAPTMGAKVDRHMSPAASRDCLDDSFTWDDGVSTDDSQWLDDEVQVLMTLWAQANIQKRLLHTATAHQVFTYLSDELTLVGFNKSPRQCSVKVSNLLEEYKKIKQAGSRENDKSGWFAILDGVLNPEAETLKNSFSAHINRKLPKDDQVNAMPEAAWTSNEVKVLLRRWAEDSIQEQLRSTETTERVFAQLSSELATQGFDRTTSQCQGKIKGMTQKYRRIKEQKDYKKQNSKWFCVMDKVLGGHKPKDKAKLVAEVTGSNLTSQLPGCRLSVSSLCLLVPTLRLMCAFAWQVVQSCNVVHYGKVEELVKLVTDLAPELLTPRERVQLLLRLRARHVLELCLSESTAYLKNIEPHLNVIQGLTMSCSCDHKEVERLENAKSNFVEVVHGLLEDTNERQRFFKEVFPLYYGQEYECTLHTLLWKFISKLDDLLPIPDIKQTAEWLSSSPTVIEECGQQVLERDQLKALLHFHQQQTGGTNKCSSEAQNIFLPTLSLHRNAQTKQLASEKSQNLTDDEDNEGFDYIEDEELMQENQSDERPLEDDGKKKRELKSREEQSHGMTSANPSLTQASSQLQICSLRKEHLMEEFSHRPSTGSGTPANQTADACDNSGKIFKDRTTLDSCTKTRTFLFPCDKCDKKYYSKESLVVHSRIHTGETPHLCWYCGHGFRSSGLLKLHIRIHTGERRYSCHICGATAIQHPTIARHMRMHTGEKNYLCSECGKAFLSSGELKLHMRTHTGERPHTCKYCGKGFTAKCHLTTHIRKHTGERPYRCFFCSKTFHTSNMRKRHMKIHSKKKSSVQSEKEYSYKKMLLKCTLKNTNDSNAERVE